MSDPILVPATPNRVVKFPTEVPEDLTPEIDDRVLVSDKSDGWKGKWMSMRKLPTGGFHGTWENIYEMLGSGAIQGQYGYLRVNDAYYPMFCTNSNSTNVESWFAVTGFTSILPAVTPGYPTVTSSPFKVLQAGKFNTYQIMATNNPLNYSATGLPPGLTCNPVTGLISGELAATGLDPSYTVEITATNFLGSGSLTTQFDISNQLLLDVLPQYSGGFTLFKLRDGYTGSCIRVRNSAGATSDVGFDSNGWVDMSAIAAHCGTGDGFVEAWYDQSASASLWTHLTNSGPSSELPMVYSAGEPILFNRKPAIWNPYSLSNESVVSASLRTLAPMSVSDLVMSFVPVDLRDSHLIGYYPGPSNPDLGLRFRSRTSEDDPLKIYCEGIGGSSYIQHVPDGPTQVADFSVSVDNTLNFDFPLNQLRTLRVSPAGKAARFYGIGKSISDSSVGGSFRGYIISVFTSPSNSPFIPGDFSKIYNDIHSRYSI